MTRHCLDLFSGLGGFSAAFADADDWTVTTVDIEAEFDPDIRTGVLELRPGDLPDPDVILASPPCEDFSVAAITHKWAHDENRRPKHLPRKAQIAESAQLVFRTLWLVYELQPDYWYLENPQGMLRTWIGPPVGQVHYCQYGTEFKKPTDLWGSHAPMEYRTCPGADQCHHLSNPSDKNTFRDATRGPEERAKVPYELSAAIRDAVDAAYANPPPEQATLAAITDGGGP